MGGRFALLAALHECFKFHGRFRRQRTVRVANQSGPVSFCCGQQQDTGIDHRRIDLCRFQTFAGGSPSFDEGEGCIGHGEQIGISLGNVIV